ncbi:unnamed protein product [Brachionus calyciflorus]|uniref:Uncharacterized protein n=1 Tax=Brachionus calyciflorus TaxID=104777 RepID=A0A814AD63_9BILA|nr:unnamed protein product [Brachionus calyciflorus]
MDSNNQKNENSIQSKNAQKTEEEDVEFNKLEKAFNYCVKCVENAHLCDDPKHKMDSPFYSDLDLNVFLNE